MVILGMLGTVVSVFLFVCSIVGELWLLSCLFRLDANCVVMMVPSAVMHIRLVMCVMVLLMFDVMLVLCLLVSASMVVVSGVTVVTRLRVKRISAGRRLV